MTINDELKAVQYQLPDAGINKQGDIVTYDTNTSSTVIKSILQIIAGFCVLFAIIGFVGFIGGNDYSLLSFSVFTIVSILLIYIIGKIQDKKEIKLPQMKIDRFVRDYEESISKK